MRHAEENERSSLELQKEKRAVGRTQWRCRSKTKREPICMIISQSSPPVLLDPSNRNNPFRLALRRYPLPPLSLPALSLWQGPLQTSPIRRLYCICKILCALALVACVVVLHCELHCWSTPDREVFLSCGVFPEAARAGCSTMYYVTSTDITSPCIFLFRIVSCQSCLGKKEQVDSPQREQWHIIPLVFLGKNKLALTVIVLSCSWTAILHCV